MGMVAECDLCKKAQANEMDVLEIKLYSSGGQPRDVYGAMVCDECLKALGYPEFLHKFRSVGAQDLVQKQLQRDAAEARRQALGRPPGSEPVPIDPRLAGKIRNAR